MLTIVGIYLIMAIITFAALIYGASSKATPSDLAIGALIWPMTLFQYMFR